jgi:DNA-binding transcriptional MocR family regulator
MVVEDDHLGPIAGIARVTLTPGRERWAAALSLAKSLGPDLRLAVLAGDATTISRVRGRQSVGPQWVSHLLQHLVAAMWADEGVAAQLELAAATYRERRERFLAALAERGIEASSTAGIATWIPVPEEAPVVQALLAAGWAVMPGAPFRLQSGRGIRVTTSTLAGDEADELAEAIRVALRPSEATRTA